MTQSLLAPRLYSCTSPILPLFPLLSFCPLVGATFHMILHPALSLYISIDCSHLHSLSHHRTTELASHFFLACLLAPPSLLRFIIMVWDLQSCPAGEKRDAGDRVYGTLVYMLTERFVSLLEMAQTFGGSLVKDVRS